MHRWSQRPSSRIIAAIVVVLGLVAQLVPASAYAVGFTNSYIRLDRMAASTTTGGTICAQTSQSLTEDHLIVTFPSAFTVNSTASNWTVTTTNLPAGSTAWPSIATASSVSGQVVTFPSGNLTSTSTLYCFNFSGTSTLTTGTAAPSQQASLETQTSGNAQIDYTQIALAVVSDDTITVTAVVPPSFSFVLDGNSDSFTSNLNPTVGAGGIVSTGGRTVTVTTNAKGGWIAWVKDSQQGLRSATANYTIATTGTVNGAPSTINGGTEGYVLDVDLTTDASGGCTLAIDAEYNGTGTNQGGTFSGLFQPIASCTGSPPATANGDVVTLIERATISGATPAGSDYTDILTVVGAGNF